MKNVCTLAVVLLISTISFAQSCVGRWVTIDDNTGKKKSVVKLYKDENGKLFGEIMYLFPREGREPDAKCEKCTDDRKDQPLLGLQLVRDLTWNGSEWAGGTIVDPENGKIYKVKMWLDGSNKDILKVRGYIGPVYRTQMWLRVP